VERSPAGAHQRAIHLATLRRLAPVLLPVAGRFIATLIKPDAAGTGAAHHRGDCGQIAAQVDIASTLTDGLALFAEALETLPPRYSPLVPGLRLAWRRSIC